MATQRIDFILSASQNLDEITAGMSRSVNRFKKDLKGQIEETKGAASSTAKFKHSMKGLAASIGRATAPIDKMLSSLGGLKGALKIGLIVAAGKRLMDFAEGGAVLEAQLSRLGRPIDDTIQRLRELQEASGGVFSLAALAKAETMQKELGVQLDFTGKDLEKLDARFTAMGMDGKHSLEQVITSLARSRKSFLQVLGLVKDLEGAYKRYAKVHDVDRRTMTEIQKREALIAEVKSNIQGIDLEAGRSVAAFEQMNAAFSDAGFYLSVALAPIGKALKPIAVLIRDIARLIGSVLRPAIDLLVVAVKPITWAMEGWAFMFSKAAEGIDFLLSKLNFSSVKESTNIINEFRNEIKHLISTEKELEAVRLSKSTEDLVARHKQQTEKLLEIDRRAAAKQQRLEVLRNKWQNQRSHALSFFYAKNISMAKDAMDVAIGFRKEYNKALSAITGVRDAELENLKTIEDKLAALKQELREARTKDTIKRDIKQQQDRIALLKRLEKTQQGITREQRTQLSVLKESVGQLEYIVTISEAQATLSETLKKLDSEFADATFEQLLDKAELVKKAQEQYNFAVKTAQLEKDSANRKKRARGRGGRRQAVKAPQNLYDQYRLEILLHRQKEKFISLKRFDAHIDLKRLHITKQIAAQEDISRAAAEKLFDERTAAARKHFKERLALQEKEVRLELVALKNQDDATQLAVIEFTQEMARLELAKTRNEMTQAEFNTRKEILKVTRDQAIEEDKRQRSAAYWTGLEETMSTTSGVMSGMSSNMGTLTNAMAQGAAITSQHIGEKKSWNETTQAGIAVGQQAATAMVEDTQKQAAIAAVFETAKGFVALASGQFAQAGFHFAAAAIFGGIGATSGGDKAEKKQARSRDRRGDSGQGGQIIVNMGSGVILGRPQDIGRAIGQATDAVFKTGMATAKV